MPAPGKRGKYMLDYDLLIFDFDGTLADSREGIAATVNHALERCGHAPVDPGVIFSLVGLPLAEVFSRLYARLGLPGDHLPAVEHYRSSWLTIGNPRIALFPGMSELIAELRAASCTLALATGKSLKGAERSLGHFGLREHFASIATTDTVARGKPFPDMLHKILGELNVAPGRALMIGDTTFDIEMAGAAGVDAVAVTYGGHSRVELEGASPKFFAESPQALSELLLGQK